MAAALFLLSGCNSGDHTAESRPSPTPPADSPAAAQVVPHTYLPRLERENYWEPVQRVAGEKRFLLQLHPQLQAPSEGPWTLTVKSAAGEPAFQQENLRVDVATGAITLLCESSKFGPGDWTATLDLEKGGRTSGAAQYVFRFRVE